MMVYLVWTQALVWILVESVSCFSILGRNGTIADFRHGRARGGGPPSHFYHPSCGHVENKGVFRNGRILGGLKMEMPIPWQASLQEAQLDSSQFSHVCGAALVSRQFVLTAAHCIKPYKKYRVVVS